jgi:peptidyl-dipeptidase A
MSSEEQEIREFLEAHNAELQARHERAYEAYWESATTGDPAAAERYARAEADLKKLYADREAAAKVKGWLADPAGIEPPVHRQLVLLDLQYTGNLLPEETIEDLSRRAAELEQVFHTVRAEFEGERVSNNMIREVLREERDSRRRREVWEASKQIGREVAEPLRELVRRRNAAARSLGFRNYYVMGLALQEQDETRLFELLESFREASEEPFQELRAELDRELSERFGVPPGELRPWHWEDPFGQEAPATGAVELDEYFTDVDLVELAREFFSGIGLPVDDVLERSDLWEREGKAQHAFAIDIDREGDVRILCNLRPTEFWAMVLLHELGHAVYDKFIPRSLPFVLRTPAHTFSTEAVAMFMGRLTRDPVWLSDTVDARLSAGDRVDIARQLRLKMLIAARWMLVMAHFERELYRDPDRDDLNRLWWDLVERMQLIRRPENRDEPDWAAKIHLSSTPVYYHNYLLGEWMASQLSEHLQRTVLDGGSLAGRPEVGEFFVDRVFAPGASLDWNSLLVEATGEGLNPVHFVNQFVAVED